jgi:hypothetical protein
VPAPQSVQLSPWPRLILPLAHGRHRPTSVTLVTPAVSVPAGHGRHDALPDWVSLALYVLAGHAAAHNSGHVSLRAT